MKKLTKHMPILLILLSLSFIYSACQKDENGKWITYYKNKTGEGYVFYKFRNDSIAPIINTQVLIESYTRGWYYTFTSHFDYAYTDNSGKYSFRFVKTINEKKVEGYYILSRSEGIHIVHGLGIHLDCNLLKNSNKILLDTLFYDPNR
jgi:hypothetical protein